MRNFLIGLSLLLLTTSAYAGQTINECVDCRVTYITKKVVKPVRVVKQYVPVVPAPVVAAPIYDIPPGMSVNGPYVSGPVQSPYYVQPVEAVPVRPAVPVYSYVPTPEASSIYTQPGYPTNVPVAASPNGCAMYVDPYDLFGQLFGGADLVESCWR